jgi:micrococcal nuclease
MAIEHQWTYPAECTHVVDGDTYDFEVDLGFGTYKLLRVRLYGVDTHETYGVPKESTEYQRGKREAEFVRDWFESVDELYIRTEKDEKGKYGRYLAHVEGDGESLADALVSGFDTLEVG